MIRLASNVNVLHLLTCWGIPKPLKVKTAVGGIYFLSRFASAYIK